MLWLAWTDTWVVSCRGDGICCGHVWHVLCVYVCEAHCDVCVGGWVVGGVCVCGVWVVCGVWCVVCGGGMCLPTIVCELKWNGKLSSYILNSL